MNSQRIQAIRPFYVMDILARAVALERSGKPVIHLEVGEPDFDTPKPVIEAGVRALQEGRTHYVPALGLPELRELIAAQYPQACRPAAERIAVTPGSSAGLQMVFAILLNDGDEVLLADPGYPCNANFVRLYGGHPVQVPCGAAENYQLSADSIRQSWTGRTKAVLIGSPANPTGSVISPGEMQQIAATVRELGGTLIVDEIYHGLVYDDTAHTALHEGEDIFIINGFSKYFGMTGWRLGWMVVPESYIDDVNKLSQNLFISASTPAQYAALHAFDADTISELEHRAQIFRERRDYLVPALRDLGFGIPVMPEGAFYVYADCTKFSDDSDGFALDVLNNTYVGITPGKDFGEHRCTEHVRFSYANNLDNLQTAVARLSDYLR